MTVEYQRAAVLSVYRRSQYSADLVSTTVCSMTRKHVLQRNKPSHSRYYVTSALWLRHFRPLPD